MTSIGRPFRKAVFAAACCVSALGCGNQIEVVDTHLGKQGESCEARSDCAGGLRCVDLVCQEQVGQARADAGAQEPTRNGPGHSCGRRADCESGLACVRERCVGSVMDAGVDPATVAPTRGGRGESCVVSNDCDTGLGCVGGTCAPRSRAIPTNQRECHRVECVDDAECCESFQPEDPALCAELDASCAEGVRSDCNLHASLCECNLGCRNSVCVADVMCSDDLDCGGSGVLRCFAGRCAQCGSDADCGGPGAACVGGLCRAGCERDEQCPLFHACMGAQCVDTGCRSDRECFLHSGNPSTRCVDGDCVTECQQDAECAAQEACVEGSCRFVGCETDAECRAVLRLAHEPESSLDRAVCRLPE